MYERATRRVRLPVRVPGGRDRARGAARWLAGLAALVLSPIAGCAGAEAEQTSATARASYRPSAADTALGEPALPRTTVDVAMPAVTGRTIRVGRGGSVQAAVDAARPGDEVVLEPGATYTGKLVLRDKGRSDRWIVIRSGGDLPAPGTRVRPEDARQLARLVPGHASDPTIVTAPGAHHYRLIGLEVTTQPQWKSAGTLVALGGGGSEQNTLAEQPHHLVLDRMYVHGTRDLDFQRCIGLNSATTAIVDSWISDCHGRGKDSQAIAGWNGTGPYLIENNHLAGAGENVMFGGADPQIPTALPRDITIRRNHFYKPLAWKGVWSVKNSLELKLGQRVLVEGNVFENNWNDAQTGFAILFKSVNQDGSAPWSQTSDVTFRYNVVRNSVHGVSLDGMPGSKAVRMARVTFAHNVFERIGGASTWGYGGRMFQVSGVVGLTLERNTAVDGSHPLYLYGVPSEGLRLTGNILGTNNYTIASADGKGVGVEALAFHAPGAVITGNVFPGGWADAHPSGNHYPRSVADIGFVNRDQGDFRLRSRSRFSGVGPQMDRIAETISTAVVGR